MGNLRILASGIRLEGTAEFLGPLYARNISADQVQSNDMSVSPQFLAPKSFLLALRGEHYIPHIYLSICMIVILVPISNQDSTLLLQSQTSINLNIGGSSGSDIAMDNTTLNITAQQFLITSPSNSSTPALSVSDDGTVSVGASQMEVTGTLGMVLNGPLETGQVSSHPNSDLNLESASGSLVIIGRGGVQIQDGPAFEGVEITSNERLSISSRSEVCHFKTNSKNYDTSAKLVL